PTGTGPGSVDQRAARRARPRPSRGEFRRHPAPRAAGPARCRHPGHRPGARGRTSERCLPGHDGADVTAVALSPPRRAGLIVARQEVRDHWLGGRALGLLFAFSLLLGATTYLTATNSLLNFLEQRERGNLTLTF